MLDSIEKLRAQLRNRRNASTFLSVSSIRSELRARRKHVIGSYVSVKTLVCTGVEINDESVAELSELLAEKTAFLWGNKKADAEQFCNRFYTLSFYALAGGGVGDESIDDVIQLAECLVRSRDIFISVAKTLVPKNMVSELFRFVESYNDSYFSTDFEDAVLGGISWLLGSLSDSAVTR